MNMRTPFAALAILMAVGAPALAQDVNGGTLTCAEFKAMDAAGKNIAMNAVRNFARESVNASAAGTVAQMDSDTDDTYMGRMVASCLNEMGTTPVIAAMQTTN